MVVAENIGITVSQHTESNFEGISPRRDAQMGAVRHGQMDRETDGETYGKNQAI